LLKGVKVSVSDTVNFLRQGPGWGLWHTRKVSCGPKVDALCHPFPVRVGG
jgi:hypothetical protein